jgi:hypothetical protein
LLLFTPKLLLKDAASSMLPGLPAHFMQATKHHHKNIYNKARRPTSFSSSSFLDHQKIVPGLFFQDREGDEKEQK